VVTALANNSKQVQDFIVEAGRAATDSATQQANIKLGLQRFPGLLEQLKPAMAKLGAASDANTPVLQNLNAASGQLHTLFTSLASCSQPHSDNQCGFASASLPALRSLGQASVTGKQAVEAARPTVSLLNKFAQPTPELAQNLAIILADLDNRGRAVEADPRSPGGKGFTGLEALLRYVFTQSMAINTFGPYGHLLAVDAFQNGMCSPYASPGTAAANLKQYGPAYRQCYDWLGPNQPGVNEPDPTNPGGCVPDPGGAPPGKTGPQTSAPACPAQPLSLTPPGSSVRRPAKSSASGPAANGQSPGATTPALPNPSATPPPSAGAPNVQSTLGTVTNATGATTPTTPTVTAPSGPNSTSSGTPSAQQAQQLLNYLLSP
jgi:hypothetical protein